MPSARAVMSACCVMSTTATMPARPRHARKLAVFFFDASDDMLRVSEFAHDGDVLFDKFDDELSP